MTQDITPAYAAYLRNPTREQRGDLFLSCKRYAFALRRKYPPNFQINGDLYDDAVETAFLKVTDGRHIETVTFPSYFMNAVNSELVNTSRRANRKKQISWGNLAIDVGKEIPQSYDIEMIREKILHRAGMLPVEKLETLYRVMEGQKWVDIASDMHEAIGTIKSRMNDIRHFFAPLLKEIGRYEGRELEGLSLILPEMRQMMESRERASHARG